MNKQMRLAMLIAVILILALSGLSAYEQIVGKPALKYMERRAPASQSEPNRGELAYPTEAQEREMIRKPGQRAE